VIIAGIILFFAAIAGNVWYDFRKWKKNLNAASNLRNHNKAWRLKAISCLPSIYCLIAGSEFKLWIAALVVVIGEIIWFNTQFDGWLSICKGKNFFYLGSKDATHDPHTDGFWMGVPTWMHISLKVGLSLLSAYVYYLGTLK